MTDIIIYGAGGFARELAWLIEETNEFSVTTRKVVCFVDDDMRRSGERVNGIEILTFAQACAKYPGAGYLIGIGSPAIRKNLSFRAEAAGLRGLSIIHPNVRISKFVDVGIGTIICAGAILTTNIRLGHQVQINLDCTIGHDVVVEDFVTLAPGVHVSGRVYIEQGVYIGTGAVIINGLESKPLKIGAGSIVGAGASVIRDVEPDTTVVGVPAKEKTNKIIMTGLTEC